MRIPFFNSYHITDCFHLVILLCHNINTFENELTETTSDWEFTWGCTIYQTTTRVTENLFLPIEQ